MRGFEQKVGSLLAATMSGAICSILYFDEKGKFNRLSNDFSSTYSTAEEPCSL